MFFEGTGYLEVPSTWGYLVSPLYLVSLVKTFKICYNNKKYKNKNEKSKQNSKVLLRQNQKPKA